MTRIAEGPASCFIATAALAFLSATPARAGADVPVDFTLPAGDAATTLTEFSHQTGWQVFFDSSVDGIRTQAVNGSLPPRAALDRMLAHTGLRYTFTNGDTVGVYARRGPATADISGHDVPRPIVVIGKRSDRLSALNYSINLSDSFIAQTGYSGLQSVLRDLPQSSGNLCEDGIGDSSPESRTNSSRGCAENLRGLGAGATKVLFDGNPIAPGGTRGAFVDTAALPITAIDHVDILPDGFSATYAADAIGGIVNFVPRKNYTGSQTLVRVAPSIGDAIGEKLISQLWGWGEEDKGGVLAFEYYSRDDLPASDRYQATSDLRSLGGSNYDSYYTDPPNILFNGNLEALQIASSGGHSQFVPGALPNQYDSRLATDILPAQQRESVYAAGHISPWDGCNLGATGLLTRRSVTAFSDAVGLPLLVTSANPFYPTDGGNSVQIEYGFQRDLGATVLRAHVWDGNMASTLTCALPRGWSMDATVGYTFEQQNDTVGNLVNSTKLASALVDPSALTAFDPFGSPTNPTTLNLIRSTSLFRGDSRIRFAHVMAQGTAPSGWGSDLAFVVGSDFRAESLSAYEHQDGATPDTSLDAARNVAAFFGEACIPIMGTAPHQCTEEETGLAPQLHLTLSGRYEHYSDFGGGTAPAIKLFWMPVSSLSWRATWSKSFKVPDLADLSETSNVSTIYLAPNPSAPSQVTPTLLWSGNNKDLLRETARTWSLTATFRPSFDPQMTLKAHYYATTFGNRIDAPQFIADALTNPTTRNWITFDPTPAQQQEVCSRSLFLGGTASCMSQSIQAIADFRLQNISRLDTRGLDVNLSHDFLEGNATWNATLDGTYIFRYVLSDPSGAFDLVNTVDNPLRVRLWSRVSRSAHDWEVSATVLYSGGYSDVTSTLARQVRAWTTVNTQVNWKLPLDPSTGGTLLTLDVQNLFDVQPPFVNNAIGLGWDPANASVLGRTVKLGVTKHW